MMTEKKQRIPRPSPPTSFDVARKAGVSQAAVSYVFNGRLNRHVSEATRAKIGIDTLKRACEEGLVKATRLPNRQWIVTESALEEALNSGITLPKAPRRAKGRRPQPEALRKAQAELLAAGIATNRKVVVPGARHMLNMEQPLEFNRIVLEFLKK